MQTINNLSGKDKDKRQIIQNMHTASMLVVFLNGKLSRALTSRKAEKHQFLHTGMHLYIQNSYMQTRTF